VRENRQAMVLDLAEVPDGTYDSLDSFGRGLDFRAARGPLHVTEGGVTMEPSLAETLGVKAGDQVRHVRF
jgi:arginine/ornithine N-succinyltransferase beta subunit